MRYLFKANACTLRAQYITKCLPRVNLYITSGETLHIKNTVSNDGKFQAKISKIVHRT